MTTPTRAARKPTLPWLLAALESRLPEEGQAWFPAAAEEIAAGAPSLRFGALLSQASRHVPGSSLAPELDERADALGLLEGWDPERWTLLETARVALVLALPELEGEDARQAIEEAFAFADEGELCALYRSLAHLPESGRFAWRAGEGARSNMRSVFEAACCDTPFPFLHFDEVAWRQAAIKCVFVEAPLWRIHGLDRRLSEELARMALDLADERRSAGRPVQHELWLSLGEHGGARALESIERELEAGPPIGRRAAALALARAGQLDRLRSLAAVEGDPQVRDTMNEALSGRISQEAFRDLDPTETGPA